MDPTANKIEQLQVAAQILGIWDACDDDGELSPVQAREVCDLANRLAELVDALAGWENWKALTPTRVR